ncbi:MAG: hypothetical protein B7X93_08850 [Hydrogenophilales bacterium 17-61-9]|nr:MAG: hypothetical protein B7X93_08850 [Hydrogenophilales bacterium 17-61-9]
MTTTSFEFIKEGEGRYEVFLVEPRTRLGLLLGKAGNWCAEDTKGRRISCFNTRKDGASALRNAYLTLR